MSHRAWIGWLLAIALACCVMPSMAQEPVTTLLHPLFQDHAVLQRDQPIPVWGNAAPGTTVSVTLAGRTVTTRAEASGRWQARLTPLAAGGPYVLSVRAGKASQVVQDVQMGDVWLCSGQSNMELPVWRALDAGSEIASATHPMIRLFTVPKAVATVPQQQFGAPVAWHPRHRRRCATFLLPASTLRASCRKPSTFRWG